MLTVEHALQIIAEQVLPIAPQKVPLAAVRGALAQAIAADHDAPPFDRSQVDGFAVRSGEVAVGTALPLAGQVDAGGPLYMQKLPTGTCVGINTGAMVPEGADAVLMVEHTHRETRDGVEFIIANQPVKTGYGIQRQGSDARAGDIILEPGARLGPAQLALGAAAGVAMPAVRRVRAAVLSTGDELVPPETPMPLPPGKIRNSNQVMLGALAREAGAEVLDLGTVGDDAARTRAEVERAFAEADLLIVCGGMSMGTRDLVPGLLKAMGVELHVEKVRIKPGKPFIMGTLGSGAARKYVAGLPGNPVSSFVTFQRFVVPMVRRMEGATDAPRLMRAQVDQPLKENGDREFYMPCVLQRATDGRTVARVLAWKGSADMFTLGKANGLIIQAAGAPGVPAGGAVEVLSW